MTKLIIFDFDGLMVESERICYRCYCEMLVPYGITFSWDDYINEFIGMSAVGTIEKMNEFYHISMNIEDVKYAIHDMEIELIKKEGIITRPGLFELLDYLDENGYQKVIATSSSPARLGLILSMHHLEDRFDGITTAAEIQHGKPAPDIFLKACEKMKIAPADALVLEDSEAGIQAAYSAGVPVICVPCFKYPGEEYKAKAAQVLDSLLDVINYLKNCK